MSTSSRANSLAVSSIVLAAAHRLARAQVELEVADASDGGVAGRRRASGAEGADAGEQLGQGERLDEVVIGAGIEARDAVADRIAGGEHEDRGGGALAAEALGDVVAVHGGEHDVEQDEVVLLGLGLELRRRRRLRPVDDVALLFEHAADGAGETAFIFDEEEVSYDDLSIPGGGKHWRFLISR